MPWAGPAGAASSGTDFGGGGRVADRPAVVVRFVDGVELSVGGERLGEVLALLRDGPADRGHL